MFLFELTVYMCHRWRSELPFHFHFILQSDIEFMLAIFCVGGRFILSAVTNVFIPLMPFPVDTRLQWWLLAALNIFHVDQRDFISDLTLNSLYSCVNVIDACTIFRSIFLSQFFWRWRRKKASFFLTPPKLWLAQFFSQLCKQPSVSKPSDLLEPLCERSVSLQWSGTRLIAVQNTYQNFKNV